MGEKKKEVPTVWFSLKKSLHCKSEPSDVHNPKTRKQLTSILTRKTGRSGCSRSISNLKDVIHGSKRHLERPPSCSPRSIGSSEFINPIAHEVILSNSRCELKITGFAGFHEGFSGGATGAGDENGGRGSTYVGNLRPGTPGPGGHPTMHYFNPSFTNSSTPPRKTTSFLTEREGLVNGVSAKGFTAQKTASSEKNCNGSNGIVCHRCGEQFVKWEALESHHLSKHAGKKLSAEKALLQELRTFSGIFSNTYSAIICITHYPHLIDSSAFCTVTELVEGDSSRKIVEIICRSGWSKSEHRVARIDRVLKVHNMQKTLSRFEDYRETVKSKASKLAKKHPRCLADGNELLRFYGTTVACSLGINGSSSLCVSDKCCVCQIIRHGFSTKSEVKGGIGVFTTSTSGRAFESVELSENDPSIRMALIVCRVIAGRVHRPLENIQEMAGQMGFDSLAGKVGLYSNIEELYLLNPKALLPCFVIICKA